ncbi:MAG: M42 family metallopeptidase [Angelakisella sp.]
MPTNYTDYAVEQIQKLCAIPSPTGFTHDAAKYLVSELQGMGFAPVTTIKGTVKVCLGGTGEGLVLAAHVDTLGAMVRAIKDNGRLRPTPLGGLNYDTCDGENCTIHTRDGRVYTGVMLNTTPSAHVANEVSNRKEENMEVLLDENTFTRDEVKALGVEVGDFIAFDPRTTVTKSGFIKSRFMDDKASAAILLAVAKQVAEQKLVLHNTLWLLFTVYEEVGHGGAASIPDGVTEMISVDMGAVGDDLTCDERKVSICAKDSGGPYNYEVTTRLIETAKEHKLDYAVDVYPHYGSDVEATLHAGYELRHGLIGPGVYASHNYERTHRSGVENTLKLLLGYLA